MMEQVVFWHWFVLGLILLIFEFFAPGAFFLWIGLAAGATGILLWIMPDLDWQYQLMWFAAFSIVSIFAWVKIGRRTLKETDHPTLNQRGQQYVGRVFTLEEPIVNGDGKIAVDDSTWKIVGEDCQAGTKVKVSGVRGVILEVEHE
ncbi:MAG: NfeD family protein [Gammaproteobacteria bacterium]|nr:NfeD family protein [Gammaproteobacteria bacterium]